jgi:polyisoprenyl-teichoic acid--peptidoglycan teichoic acid transferase
VALCLVAAGAGYGYLRYRFGQIRSINLSDVIRHHGKAATDNPGNVMNVLLVGSDTRSDIAKNECKKFGCGNDVGGQRSDTIMILHVDPKQKKAAILSLPRDLYIPIADTKGSQRINTAFDAGPARLIKTITQDFGVPIDHYLEVDFNGFRGIVNTIGGVNVYFASPERDAFSGLHVSNPGCIHLDGEAALSYVRARHLETFESGRWREDPTGDLGRIQRQQDFIRRVLRKAITSGLTNPLKLNALAGNAVNYVTKDGGLSINDMKTLAQRFKSLSPDAVDMETLPSDAASVRFPDGSVGSVLKLKQPDANQMLDRFTGKTPAASGASGVPSGVLPNDVHVRVLNGSGQSGIAGRVSQQLQDVGFGIRDTGDADSFRYISSVISYGPGQLAKAQLLQASLNGSAPQLKQDLSIKGVDLVLIVGSDFSGVRDPTGRAPTTTATAPPASTPSTTVPAARGNTPAAASC